MPTKSLDKILDHFDEKKSDILQKIENEIKEYVCLKETTFCLSLVDGQGKKSEPSANPFKLPAYATKLALFLTSSSDIDSCLTKPITDKVSETLCSFYQGETNEISQYVQEAILEDETLRKVFRDDVLGALVAKHISKEAKKQIIDLIMESLRENAGDITSVVGQKVSIVAGKAVALSANIPISKAIASKIAILIGSQLKYFLAKALAAPAIKAIIVPVVKKVVIVGIVAGFVKLIAAKTGASVGAVVAVILIPIILWWIRHEWQNFPENLGGKVARKVREELSGNYRSMNMDILEGLPEDFMNRSSSEIAKKLLSDDEIKAGVEKLSRQVEKMVNLI